MSLKLLSKGRVQAIFNQSTENFILDRNSVDLTKSVDLKMRKVILSDGIVVCLRFDLNRFLTLGQVRFKRERKDHDGKTSFEEWLQKYQENQIF